MPVDAALQTQWDAFLKLIQVKEARLYDHLKKGRIKEITKYNVILLAQTPEELKEIEVGLKVYHDKITELVPTIFGGNRGIKVEGSSEADWEAAAPADAVPAANLTTDQNELLKFLETSIRQRVEVELRTVIENEVANGKGQEKLVAKLKEDFEEEENNRKLAVRMSLAAEGDKILSQLMITWQQAKQSGDGGEPWNEVKRHLMELLDITVQLSQT
jgi:hypothetical protein